MHEMIKMSIAHLLGALSSRIFIRGSSSVAFQKVPCPAILEHRPSVRLELNGHYCCSLAGMGREEKKEISTMLFPENQPTSKNGILSINSGTAEKGLQLKRMISAALEWFGLCEGLYVINRL